MSRNEKQDKHESHSGVSNSKKSSASSYKEYKQNKKRKRSKAKGYKLKSNSIDPTSETNTWNLLFTKEYLLNKYNLLRLVILIVAFILLLICILYGVGSVITLELDDFWCTDQYSWDEVAEYNRENNNSLGVGGCYVANKLQFDENKVFATNSSESALVPVPVVTVPAIFKAVIYSTICIGIVSILIKYTLTCFTDCQKTVKNEW